MMQAVVTRRKVANRLDFNSFVMILVEEKKVHLMNSADFVTQIAWLHQILALFDFFVKSTLLFDEQICLLKRN